MSKKLIALSGVFFAFLGSGASQALGQTTLFDTEAAPEEHFRLDLQGPLRTAVFWSSYPSNYPSKETLRINGVYLGNDGTPREAVYRPYLFSRYVIENDVHLSAVLWKESGFFAGFQLSPAPLREDLSFLPTVIIGTRKNGRILFGAPQSAFTSLSIDATDPFSSYAPYLQRPRSVAVLSNWQGISMGATARQIVYESKPDLYQVAASTSLSDNPDQRGPTQKTVKELPQRTTYALSWRRMAPTVDGVVFDMALGWERSRYDDPTYNMQMDHYLYDLDKSTRTDFARERFLWEDPRLIKRQEAVRIALQWRTELSYIRFLLARARYAYNGRDPISQGEVQGIARYGQAILGRRFGVFRISLSYKRNANDQKIMDKDKRLESQNFRHTDTFEEKALGLEAILSPTLSWVVGLYDGRYREGMEKKVPYLLVPAETKGQVSRQARSVSVGFNLNF